MEPDPANPGPLIDMSKRFGRRLLAIGENRFGLLMVEVQEERERLLHAILQALGVAASGGIRFATYRQGDEETPQTI